MGYAWVLEDSTIYTLNSNPVVGDTTYIEMGNRIADITSKTNSTTIVITGLSIDMTFTRDSSKDTYIQIHPTIQWLVYNGTNKEQRTSATYPIAFNRVFSRMRTNTNGSDAGVTPGGYKFLQISGNTQSGDSPDTTTVYFYETSSNRISRIYIMAIGI